MQNESIIQANNAHCLCGQSPIGQLDNTNKFLKDHAMSNPAKAILNRFAHKKGSAKNKAAKLPMISKNNPGLPKLVPFVSQPVTVK